MARPIRVELSDSLKIQFNTRISYRMRAAMDDYLDYMKKPLKQRPQNTEEWPNNIVAVIDEALTMFFAEYPRRPRKGPSPETIKRKANARKAKESAKKRTQLQARRRKTR